MEKEQNADTDQFFFVSTTYTFSRDPSDMNELKLCVISIFLNGSTGLRMAHWYLCDCMCICVAQDKRREIPLSELPC